MNDKLFDVVAVRTDTGKVSIVMAKDKTPENAEAIVNLAVLRRGVESEFFAKAQAGKYKGGEPWTGA